MTGAIPALSHRLRPLLAAIDRLADQAALHIDRTRQMDSEGSPEASGTATAPVAPRLRDRYGLTPREREVLLLLTAGHSDGEIAKRLFISKKTASVHVARIKGKLGARSRVEIATDAIGLGLVDSPTAADMPAPYEVTTR